MPDVMSWKLALLVLATFLASAVSTSVGFGFGLVLVSLLQFFVSPVQIVGLGIITSIANYLLRTTETRQITTDGTALRVTLSGILGVPLGVALLRFADPIFLRQYFSLAILAIAVLLLLGFRGRYVVRPVGKAARVVQAISGALGGFMCGSSNLGGPAVVFCALIQHWEKMRAHAVFSRYFLATSGASAIGLTLCGLYDRATILTAVGLVPVVWVGFAVGVWLRDRISGQQFRRLLMVFLALLAVAGFLNTFL